MRANSSIHVMEHQMFSRSTSLEARGAIHVSDAGIKAQLLRAYRIGEDHEAIGRCSAVPWQTIRRHARQHAGGDMDGTTQRCFTLSFSNRTISDRLGSARILRLPSAARANSMRRWNSGHPCALRDETGDLCRQVARFGHRLRV